MASSLQPASEGGSASTELVTVPQSELSTPLTLVLYGDMRFTDASETASANPAARRALVAKVGGEHPDAVVLTGDIPWHGGVLGDYRVYAAETTVWQDEHLRVYPVLGNHEFSKCEESDCLENWWHAFPFTRGHRWYGVALGDSVRVLALDSDTSLLAGSEQRAWLEHEIATLPPTVEFVLLALHHPPVANNELFVVRPNERSLADYLRTAAAQSRARFIVVSGHVHNYERFERDRVVYLVSGGGGAKPLQVLRGPGDRYRGPSFPNYHYLRIEIAAKRLRARMQRLTDYDSPAPHRWTVEDRFELQAN